MKTKIKFYLQSRIEKTVPTDMELEILRSREYWRWRNLGLEEDYQTEIEIIDTPAPDVIPLGSVEFVRNYTLEVDQVKGNKIVIPIGIPNCMIDLKDFGMGTLGRICVDRKGGDMCPEGGWWFVKSKIKCKDENNGWYNRGDILSAFPHNTLLRLTSRLKEEIKGEFRVFLGRRGEIKDVRNYIGWECWPNLKKLKEWAKTLFSTFNRPLSFDVIVTSTGNTYFLEAHDYWALGLYGFSEPQSLPFYIKDWWDQK